MSSYHVRQIEPIVDKYLKAFPVLGLTGPRQSGKSTLLQHLLKNYTYVSFDDYKMRNFIHEDPEGFMKRFSDKVIFDEAQKVPELFELVKIAVDQDRMNYGKYVLTGSSQFTLLHKISESLAGRIGLLSLLPYQYLEVPPDLRNESIYRGAYPELTNRAYDYFDEWYTAYIDTYINKDVREISNIGNLRDFERFIRLLAANTAQPLNMSTYSHDLGVSVPTIKSWLSVLEASYIVFLIAPYFENYGKRITKSPKLYFWDTGLASYLTGHETEQQYLNGPMRGAIFENYIVSEINKKIHHAGKKSELYYFRSSAGLEVDLIVDNKLTRDFIEIKATASFKTRMLNAVQQLMGANDRGYLLYNGENFPYKDNIKIIHYSEYLSAE